MSIVIDYTKGFFEPSPAGETVGDISGNATLDLTTGNVFSYTPAADTTFVFNNPPASGTAYGMTLKVTGADVAAGYDLANASYDSVSFSVSGQDTSPRDVEFSTDGTKMYVVGSNTDRIYQYTLSTAWDLSTASYASLSFSVSGQITTPINLKFKPDGTKMYVLDATGKNIYQYALGTPWTVNTASYESKSFSIESQDTGNNGILFKPDGTKMFTVGATNDNLYSYSLSTAWDISTASYDSVSVSISATNTSPTDVEISSGGTKLFVLDYNSGGVFEFSLSTAWDLSTASYSGVSFALTNPTVEYGFYFKTDGTKMYVCDFGTDTIYQYSTAGSSAPATFTYPASVDWPSGTAPDAPSDGETDVLSFYTADGGTTWYGFQVGDALA